MMNKVIRNFLNVIIIILFIIAFILKFNTLNAGPVSNLIENGNVRSTKKMPIYVEDIVKGLGTAVDYSVFANTFNQQTHMEGNIAVKDAYIHQIFNFTNAVVKVNKSNSYAIEIQNTINGEIVDGTFRFALFTKETNEQGEEQYVRTSHEIKTVTTINGEGMAIFNNLDPNIKYYIFELDENDNPIMNNTTKTDGTLVTYGDEEILVNGTALNYENTSYIENIVEWHDHAADNNDGDNPKLVIPMEQYLKLTVDSNGSLSHNNTSVVLGADSGDNSKNFELIVIGEDGTNYTVVRNEENNTYELKERENNYKRINFEEEFTKLNNFSSILYNSARSSDEVSVINLDVDGDIYNENGEVNGLNNGKAESETLDVRKYLEDNKYLLINVDTSGIDEISLSNSIEWGDLGGSYAWNTLSTRILWNFYNKDTDTPYTGDINIQKNNIMGTILAPSANVIVGTTINASIIANEVSNPGGEVHKSQFNLAKSKIKMLCSNDREILIEGSFGIKINKIDKFTSEDLKNVEFKITLKDEEKTILEKTDRTNELGEINIDDIPLEKEGKEYTLTIEEITPPNGYNNLTEKIEIKVKTIMKNYKYMLEPIETYEKDGVQITVFDELIDVIIPNSKINGNFNIKLIKTDISNNNTIDGMVFDIEVLDENNNKIDLIDNNTEEQINLSGLITEDGVINLGNIKITEPKKYTMILTERQNDMYEQIDPIIINMETIEENGEYKLGEISLQDTTRADVMLEKENNTIIIQVKNKKIVNGKYNIIFQKINSLTKAGLNGVKFHISIYDDENNIIVDENMSTQTVNGEVGFIDINDIPVKKPGVHRCVITEIETLDGYKKFEQTIIAEIEFGTNDNEDGYEIKSVKNLGIFSENLKIEQQENTNNVLIALANDPLEAEGHVTVDKPEEQNKDKEKDKEEDKEEEQKPGILPQTGDMTSILIIVLAIITENVIIGIVYYVYKKH